MTSGRPRVPGVPASGRKDREEDLLLFKEMFKREREHTVSLLQPVSDEFEPSQGNLHLYKIPSSKKGADTEEKNDYDWLKTPPATPLFPSLELEANENLANMVVHKELPILQPIKPSRFSSKNEVTKPTQRSKSPSSTSVSSSRSVTPRLRPNSMANGKKMPMPMPILMPMPMPMNSTSSTHNTNQSRTNKSINSSSIPSTPMNIKVPTTKSQCTTTLPEKTEVRQSMNRRLSCSPKMIREIKNESNQDNVKVWNISVLEKNNNGLAVIVGSKMVDKGKSINSPFIPSTPMNNKEVSTESWRTTTLEGKTKVKQKMNRRLSSSPKMIRGIKSESNENDMEFRKMSIQEKNNNDSAVVGSKMVDRMLNARRITDLNGEKKTMIKAQDDARFGRFKAKASLDKTFENLDEKRSEGMRSCNLVESRTTKHRFNVENRTQLLKKKVDDKRNKFVMS